jgi:FAD/FMN-containing dehydrogenase
VTSTEHAAVITQRQSPENTPAPDRTGGAGRELITPTPAGAPAWKRRISSHETFDHNSIDSLGYDWERISNPGMAPRFPRKIYLPQTTEDIVEILREVKALGEPLAVRSKGHSSNDLVLTDGGSLLLTEKLNRIVEIDTEGMTATVQSGAVSAQVDDHLSTMGLGFPIIGDHNHITVGGFASVGGISPASHRFGLFVDTVQAIEYVTWDGELVRATREENADHFHKVLTGLGQHGVLATLTVRIIRIDKYTTVLKNDQKHYWDVASFVAGSGHAIRNPGTRSTSGASGSTSRARTTAASASGSSPPTRRPSSRRTPKCATAWRTTPCTAWAQSPGGCRHASTAPRSTSAWAGCCSARSTRR